MRGLTLGFATAVTCVLATTGPLEAQTGCVPDYSVLPLVFEKSQDPNQQQFNFYDFIWRSFIALNWPNVPIEIEDNRIVSGMRGKPDASKQLAVMSGTGKLPQAVWETYKEPYEVFPDPDLWDSSGLWNSVRPAPPDKHAHHKHAHHKDARRLLRFPTELAEYTTDDQQPYFYPDLTGPLYDQDQNLVRYEVAVNRAFFRYIRHFEYFNAEKQETAVKNYIDGKRDETAFQRPPFGNPQETGPGGYLHDLPDYAKTGFVDVKAAWRVLDPDNTNQFERYLHRKVIFYETKDREVKLKTQWMGLVALHILRWTPNGYDPVKGVDGAFVASTFEHIDNVRTNIDRHGKIVKPTFNNGHLPTPAQLEFGFTGDVPAFPIGKVPSHGKPISIYRAAAQRIPAAVQKLNKHYQTSFPVNTSVLQYYELIGTQNRHQGPVDFATAAGRERNGHQGPITGVFTNSNNLVNSALESYSQKNFSCIQCHTRARPHGVPKRAFEDDHFKIITFMLNGAHTRKHKRGN